MSNSYTFIVLLLSLGLSGCTTLKLEQTIVEEVVTEVPVVTLPAVTRVEQPILLPTESIDTNSCNPSSFTKPELLLTGIERGDNPVVLMTRQELNEKLAQSPLWMHLYDKDLNFASYGHTYYFEVLDDLIGSSSFIRVYSYIDGHYWSKDQRITLIRYGLADMTERIHYHHQLLEQERNEMIEVVTLVIEDREKATEIIDRLYRQYLETVDNEDYLSDGQTFFTYLEYEGKYFSFLGARVTGHRFPRCNYDSLFGLDIN